MILCKHSGRHAFKDKLGDLGYVGVTDDVIESAFGKFIEGNKPTQGYDAQSEEYCDMFGATGTTKLMCPTRSLRTFFSVTSTPQRSQTIPR